jgi:hypothetical protein
MLFNESTVQQNFGTAVVEEIRVGWGAWAHPTRQTPPSLLEKINDDDQPVIGIDCGAQECLQDD